MTMRRLVVLTLLSQLVVPQIAAAATRLRMYDSESTIATYKNMGTALGSASTTSVTNTVAGPTTTGVQWTKTGGGTLLQWISPPLAAGVTISGSVTLNTWALIWNDLSSKHDLRLMELGGV